MQIKMFIPENGHPEKKTGRVLMSVLRPKWGYHIKFI